MGMLEVTSLNRPDTDWTFTDAKGHKHQWYRHTAQGVEPAKYYIPMGIYILPTLNQVTDVEASEEYPGSFHFECRLCGEVVKPGRRADDTAMYIQTPW